MIDEELIALIDRVKKKDDSAFSTLVTEFRYLLYSVFSKYFGWYEISPDDLMFDVLSCFWETIVNYDEKRTSRDRVREYISNTLFQRVYNLLQSFHYKKKDYIHSNTAKDKNFNKVLAKIFLEDILEMLKKSFDVQSCKIFEEYYLNNLNQQEVARICGVSQSFVSIVLKKVKTFLEEKINVIQLLL